jgi:hypothetical protein
MTENKAMGSSLQSLLSQPTLTDFVAGMIAYAWQSGDGELYLYYDPMMIDGLVWHLYGQDSYRELFEELDLRFPSYPDRWDSYERILVPAIDKAIGLLYLGGLMTDSSFERLGLISKDRDRILKQLRRVSLSPAHRALIRSAGHDLRELSNAKGAGRDLAYRVRISAMSRKRLVQGKVHPPGEV